VASQSLYRKYRPQFFRELKGQEHVTTALRNALREDRVGHAYLFSGPRGTGKTTTARLLAKALNCLNLGADGEPDGICDNCVSVAAGTFPDLIELDAASNNGVQAIRDLVDKVHFGLSATGKRKVYVIDEVHMLSTGASNALLKTLEEPPAHVVFVLATTDPHKVLPTIRSRTQHFEFNLLSNDDLRAHVVEIAEREGIAIDLEAVDAVVRQGAGSARDALSKLDMALAVGTGNDEHHVDTSTVLAAFGGTRFDRRVSVLQAIADDDAAGALIAVEDALRSGIDPRELAEELLTTLRDTFVRAASGGRVEHDGPSTEADRLDELGAASGLARLTRGIETLGDAIADMRGAAAPDPRLLLEVAVVRLARREARAGIDAVLERIERLEARVEQLASGGSGNGGNSGSGGSGSSGGGGTSAPPAPKPSPQRPAASPRQVAPAKPAAPSAPTAEEAESAKPADTARAALGAFTRNEPAAPSTTPTAAAEPADDAPTASSEPLDFDDVIVAWSHTLESLNNVARAMVQAAVPIGLDGDTVVFGVPKSQLVAVQTPFRNNADEIRGELAKHLGRRMMFKLAEHDFDAPGALQPRINATATEPDDAPANTATAASTTEPAPTPAPAPNPASKRPAKPAPAASRVAAEPPAEDPPDDFEVDLSELIDARDAPPLRDTAQLLMAEFGAQVVEERPLGQ
jgi:DNA polymerase-3 subunit gamma/tau